METNISFQEKSKFLKSLIRAGTWIKIIAIVFLTPCLQFFVINNVKAQSGLCNPGVPFFNADLSANPEMTYISPLVVRNQLCCGNSNPDRCIEFSITLHPDAIAVNFQIASGAIPPGSMYYQINCGPPVPVGQPICLTGGATYTLTFCKPGNNANTYAITSIPKPSVSDPNFATETCPATININGILPGTVSITDISGGGSNLAYLSCTNCLNPIVRPFGSFPAYADYKICGTPMGSACLAGTTWCDTVRVYFYDTLSVSVNPNPASFCLSDGGLLLTSNVANGVPPYTYEWYSGPNGTGVLLSTAENLYVSTSGTYSLVVNDSISYQCGNKTVNVVVNAYPNPLISFTPNSPYICRENSVEITASGASTYNWSPPDGLSSTTGATVTASPDVSTTYTVTGTDIHGCSNTANIFVKVCDAPAITASGGGDICIGQSLPLSASGAMFYSWSPVEGLNDPNIPNPIATPNSTTQYVVTGYDVSCNVIVNGDFSQGNTGFSTAYNYSPNLYPEGNYYIGSNPNNYHANFAPCGDHTTGSGNMMIVNGNRTANQPVWCQDIHVNPNTDYIFSTWITSVHPANPAVLQFSINGVLLGSPFAATSTVCQWNEFYEVWNSGSNTSITICIVNQNTIANGNDFAIDDIYFAPLCSSTDTVTITVHVPPIISFTNTGAFCVTDPDTNIIANPSGGIWSGTGIVDPINGTFSPSLAGSGTHSISYSYNDGFCQVDTIINIIVDAMPNATITPVGPFCQTDATVILNAATPGGIWSGTGVVGNTFNPALAGPGDHLIQYVVTNGACSDSDTETIHVDSQVDATITAVGPFCETGVLTFLVAATPGGIWSGNGVVGNTFDPALAGPGDHLIQYVVTNGACSDSDTETIHVDSQVDANITPVGPFCQTDATVILNAATPGGIWSGTGVVGNTFNPALAGPGDHIIQYVVTNGACSDTDTETIHVDSQVDATITPVGPFCENGVLTFLVAATPGGVWSGTGVVGNTFDPALAGPGDHIIQYVVTNGACSDTDTETIHVDSQVNATITPVGPFCQTDAAVALNAATPGGTWAGTGVVGNTFDPALAGPGDHIIQYVVTNGACSDTDTETIHVDSQVNATITPVGPFCQTDAAVALNAATPGGTWAGTGVVGNTFNPALAGPGDHIIQYVVTNGACSDTDTETVHVDSQVNATITPVGPFCQTDAAVALNAATPGGTWAGTGVVGNTFDPALAGPGDHIIQYVVTNGACSDTDTETIHVDSQVDATITPVGPFCQTDAAVALNAATPGGTWAGTGVVGNTFDPALAGPGDHIIQYSVTNGACSDNDTEIIHVDSQVDATITPVGPFCQTDASVNLNAATPGGTWAGTGVVGNTFDPALAGPGDHIIQYVVTNGACSDTDTETIHVDSQVNATITPVGPFCQTDAAVTLNAATPGGTWSGTGVVGNTFNPALAGPGDHIIQYVVTNGACSDTDTETVHVDSQVNATITPVGPFCQTDAAVALNAATPGGTWAGTGVVGNTFDPALAGPGDHIIQYVVTNGACSDTDTETIHVDSQVDATITPVGPFCQTDAAVALNAATPGGTWAGTGVVGNTFDPALAGPGDHIIQYSVTNGACSDNDTEIIHVDSQVDATITPVGPFCQTDASVNLNAATPGGTWAGTGVVGNTFDPALAGPGDHIIQYVVTNGACSDTDTETIHVDSQVDATITPVGPFCQTDAAVTLNAATPDGTWSGNGVVGNTFDPALAGPGDHIIQYVVTNGACSDTDTETIHVDSQVDATITPVGPFCQTDAAVNLNAATPGGTWAGTGVVGNTFDPVLAGPGDYIIQYVVTNGACSDNDTETIHVDSQVDATITPVGPFCQTDAAVALNAATPGGTWSGTGVVGNTFDPVLAGPGDHIIQYSVTNGACSDNDTEIIHVDSQVDATITPVGPFCQTDAAVALNAATPGGTWAGTGVVGNTFDPALAGPGDHIIQYVVTNGACSDTDTETIHVDSQVNATITPVGPFCQTDAAVALNAATPGGTWAGTGVVGNTFDPDLAGPGDHIIQYVVTNGACSDTDTETIHVDSQVNATITPVGPFCQTDAAVTLNAATPDGTWSGNGVVGNTFDPALAGPGDHIIQYVVTNGACSDNDTEIIHVDSFINPIITVSGPYCENDPSTTLQVNVPGGLWSGTGIIDITAGVFAPSIAGQGDHIITYNFVNGACSSSANTIIHVDPVISAEIVLPPSPICHDYGIITLQSINPGGIWSGTGVVGNTFNPLIAGQGDHNISYTIVFGACSSQSQTIIHVDTIPVINVTGIGPFCESTDFAYLQASPNGGIWSGVGVTNPVTGQFSPLFSGPGDHTVTYTVVNGMCSAQSSITVHVDNYLDPTITPINNVCQNGPQISLQAATSGGIWAGPGIIDPVNGILDPSLVEHGNNTMTYTITNGSCISTDLHIYQVDAFISAEILSDPGSVCLNASPFQLISQNPGGTWSGQGIGNPSTGTFIPSQAGVGIHTISYTIINGACIDTDQIQIEVINVPNTSINPSVPYCETESDVVLTAATSGGVWSGTGITDPNSGVFSPSAAGPGVHLISYSITIGSCSSTSTTNIIVNSSVDATITPITPVCQNVGNIPLNAANPGGIWSGTGVVGNNFNTYIAGVGNHQISYTVTNGACSDTDEITITVDEFIPVNITPVSSLCLNSTPIILNASIPGGVWSGQGITDPNVGIFDPSQAGAGNHNILYSFINGSCISNAITNIAVNPLPVPIISGLNQEYCQYENFTVVIVSPPGGTLSGPGIQGFTFNPSIAGPGVHTITYNVTNTYNCSGTAQTSIIVHPSIQPDIIIPGNQFCFNGPIVSLDAIPTGGIFSGPGVVGYKFAPEVAGSGTHNISYIYTDENNCQNYASVQVEVSTPIEINITGENPACFGSPTGSLHAVVSGGVPDYSYQWNDPENSTTPNISNLTAGTYNLTVTDQWSCTLSANYNLISPSQLNVSISSQNNPSCNGYNNGSIMCTVNGGTAPYSFTWDNVNSSNSILLSSVGAGTYTVTVTDYHGCTGTATGTLTEPDELVTEIVNVNHIPCAGQNSGSASVMATGGTPPYSYLWNNPAQTPLATAQNLPAGTYTVTVTDSNGCTSTSTVSIEQTDQLNIALNSTDVVCTLHPGSASVSVSGGTAPYSYNWSNGSNTTNIDNLLQGTYYVTVRDINNCSSSGSVNIGISGSIHTSISLEQPVICAGSATAVLLANSQNGISPVYYHWSNGIQNNINTNISFGNYSVTATDAWGCTGTAQINVEDAPGIEISGTVIGAGCTDQSTGSIDISITGGHAPYFISWSTGATTSNISGLAPGNYSVTVTDANNCTAAKTFTVNNPQYPLSAQIIKSDITCKGNNDGSITINPSGGTPPYSYLWQFGNNSFTGRTASNLSPGTYLISVFDNNGCEWNSSIMIYEPEELDYNYISINPSCIGNNDGYIEISITGGNPPYLISWADQTAPIEYITGLSQGTYSFTITDNNGCKKRTEYITLIDEDVECIIIPNAFTPNNDGINDTWIIENIGLYPWAQIEVFNRWGQLVFEGKGNGAPWDGTWNGKPVPTGSYVYTVDLFNGTKYCGIVTVVR